MAKAKPEDVTLVDLDGRPHSGDLRPTSELQLHLGVYRTTTAHSVVHTHAPAAVSLSLIATELPPIHYQQLALGGSVPILPF
ncbi:class II aldolase/adducin family protein, partial [Mycobacterium kansasii]